MQGDMENSWSSRRGSSPWAWVSAQQMWKSVHPAADCRVAPFHLNDESRGEVGGEEGQLMMGWSSHCEPASILPCPFCPRCIPRGTGGLFAPIRTVKWHCWHLNPRLFPGLSFHPLGCCPAPSEIWNMDSRPSVFSTLAVSVKLSSIFWPCYFFPHI